MFSTGEKLSINIEQWENSISAKEKLRLTRLIQFSFNDWMANLLQYLNKQQLLHIEAETEEVEPIAVVEAA